MEMAMADQTEDPSANTTSEIVEAPKPRRGRPPGIKNKPGAKKPGPRPKSERFKALAEPAEDVRSRIRSRPHLYRKPGTYGYLQDPKMVPSEMDLFGNFRTYCQELLWIRNKKGRVIPFRWNIVQERLDHQLTELTAAGKRLRLILKYRRAGITTYHQAKSFFLTANN
jgi:hypothetical protein